MRLERGWRGGGGPAPDPLGQLAAGDNGEGPVLLLYQAVGLDQLSVAQLLLKLVAYLEDAGTNEPEWPIVVWANDELIDVPEVAEPVEFACRAASQRRPRGTWSTGAE